MAKILDRGGKLDLRLQQSQSVYIRRDKMVQAGATVKISVAVPSPQNATLARLLNKVLMMQKFTADRNAARIVVTCPGGKKMITIDLCEREQLAVSFSHLVGFTHPKFATYANLSLAAFACDRNFVTVADGPGILILETHGNHTIHRSGKVVIDCDQLVAWDPKTVLRLDRVHSLTDLYLNRARIFCSVSTNQLPMIVDSAVSDGLRPRHPLWGFLKSVYFPKLH